MPRTKAAKCAKQTKRTPVGGASGAQVRAVRKRAVGAGRTKAARLKRANPKASRKKAAPVKSTSKMKSDAAAGRRMSNFNTSLRKNKAPVKQKSAKSPVAEKALVKKEGMSKSLKKPASKASPVTTTTSTVFAVISTTSSAECATTSSQKVSIAMYREAGAQRKSRDLEHIADSIERVVSASHEWPVDATPGDARRSRSASSSDSSDVAINARRSKSASKRAPKRAPSPPPRRRLASLNALAKVHCLYESEARGASRKRASDTSSSDSTDSSDATSDSSSDSSDARRRREPDARRAKAAPVKKRPKPAKKRTAVKKPRRSMEVSAASLVQLVTPKRMASLNATAILAASSQHWSDSRSRRKNQTRVDTESDSDTDEGNKTQEDDDKEKGGARGGRREGEPRPFASAIVTSSVRVSTVIQQQADGGGKQTTTKSTFLAHESTVGPGATKKSFQQHVTCLKVSPSDADGVGVDQCEVSLLAGRLV